MWPCKKVVALVVFTSIWVFDNGSAAPAAKEKPMNTLGLEDPAPTLDSAILIKGNEIPRFSADRIYVLDFWASNCGPCVRAMPHLRALGEQYKDRVTIISVNVEKVLNPKISKSAEHERVTKFVKEKDDLMNYTVIMDDEHGTLAARWLTPSGLDGLPVGFIIANNRIAWAGVPLDKSILSNSTFDQSLAAIAAGTNPDQRLHIKQDIEASGDALELRRLKGWTMLIDAQRAKNHPTLVQIYEEAIAINPRLERALSVDLFNSMLHTQPARAYSYAREALDRVVPTDTNLTLRSMFLISFAESIITEAIDSPNLDIALKWAQEAVGLTPKKSPGQHMMLAKIYFVRGELEEAIQIQERAIAIVNEDFVNNPQSETRVQSLAALESILARYRTALNSKPVKSDL